ncbi:MAG TPA: hypothetical protein VD884_07020 [Ohtaekwangia sp.]|nr:hypothetical protein [Ohtaekwangia sp.]
MKKWLAGFTLGVLTACSPVAKNDVIIDIKSIVNKNPEQVIEMLGNPDSSYNKIIFGKAYFIQQYEKLNEAEIRFLNNVAHEVIINRTHGIDFNPTSLNKFGFEEKAPSSFDTTAFYAWKNLDDIQIANMYLIGTRKTDSTKHNFKIYFRLRE